MEMEGRILIVEDSAEMMLFLSGVLGEKYLIVTAKDGMAALAMLQEETVDLVISDVVMPEMDGLELCASIKSDVRMSHIPILLLTARREQETKVAGLELGADVYIEKPVAEAVLLAQVASLLGNRKRVREFFVQSPWAQLSSIACSKEDERFLLSLNTAIGAQLENPELGVEMLAGLVNMSRATFYRKIKAITDVSPLELINIVRLKKAAELLLTTDYKIDAVAVMTGFSSQSSFSRNFVRQFGLTPTEYKKGRQ